MVTVCWLLYHPAMLAFMTIQNIGSALFHQVWRRLECALSSLISSFKGANTSYKKFMDKKESDRTKAENKKKEALDKQKLSQQKQDLDNRARKLATSGIALPGFFSLERSLFAALPEKPFDKDFDTSQACTFSPVSMKEILEEYLTKPIVQQVLTGFGGRYKKLEGYKEEGKVSSTLMVKQGKEDTEAFFSKLVKALALLPIS